VKIISSHAQKTGSSYFLKVKNTSSHVAVPTPNEKLDGGNPSGRWGEGTATCRLSWFFLGALLKISDKHHDAFYIGVPQGSGGGFP